MNNLIKYAHLYINAGFKPFPLVENSKTPATRNGFKDAISDHAQVDSLFANHTGNIGITFPPDLFALDLDRKNGKDGVAALEQIAEPFGGLPPTLTQVTPTGGEHRIYRKPVDLYVPNTSNILADGIDTRTHLGYIVCEPSIIDGNQYSLLDCSLLDGDNTEIADAPDWLIDLLGNWRKPKVTTEQTGKITEGGRNDRLTRIAGSMRKYGADENSIYAALSSVNATQCNPPLPDSEVRTIAHSIARYEPEQNLASVITKEREQWLVPASEIRKKRTIVKWLIKHWLPRDGLIMLHGASGSGKSLIVLDMVARIASLPEHPNDEWQGIEWEGNRVRHGNVVYLAGEGYIGMNARIEAWCKQNNVDNVNIWVSKSGCDLNTPDGYIFARDEIAAMNINPCLIVVDTLHRFMNGDENSSQDAKTMIDACNGLMREFHCATLLVHHTGVSEEAQKRARGSSAWRGALESEISVTPAKDDQPIEICCMKTKDGKIPDPKYMQICSFKFDDWEDQDGEKVTAGYVVSSEKAQKEQEKESNDKTFFQELVKKHGEMLEDGSGWISENAWSNAIIDAKGEKTDALRNARLRMKKRMLKDGFIIPVTSGYATTYPISWL